MSKNYTVKQLEKVLNDLGCDIKILPETTHPCQIDDEGKPLSVIIKVIPIYGMGITVNHMHALSQPSDGYSPSPEIKEAACDISRTCFAMFKENIALNYRLPEKAAKNIEFHELAAQMYDRITCLDGKYKNVSISSTIKTLKDLTKELKFREWLHPDTDVAYITPNSQMSMRKQNDG